MRFARLILALALGCVWLSGCSESYVIAYAPDAARGPACRAHAEREGQCGDQRDDDCDGFVDCLDPDCAEQSCGAGSSCVAGACLDCQAGALCAESLPAFDGIRVETRGDTAIIEFAPVPDAVDYRIYPLPAADAVGRDAQGRQTIRDAIYRCAGKRTVADRAEEYGSLFSESLITRDNGYERSADEALLGYVFAHAAPGRLPVYRLADPNGHGGYFNAEWIAPLYHEAFSAEYVIEPERRAELLRKGFRDDGIAFYVPERGDLTLYRVEYEPGPHQGARVSFFFTDGAEYDARTGDDQALVLELGSRFSIFAEPQVDAVPLRRVTYRSGSSFDVLAAGEAMYQRVLHQAGPVTSLTWSGLSEPTVLVIEALDAGCPFPNAYVGAAHAEAPSDAAGARGYPTDTLAALRRPETGEVYLNAQHDPESRPSPIARSFVSVTPRPLAPMAFASSFSDPDELADMRLHEDTLATVYRNARWSIEATGCEKAQLSFGSVLGQLFLGMPECRLSLVPRGVGSHLAAKRFLHVRMATDLPSTARRYPQLLITTARSPEVGEVATAADLVIHNRLGPLATSELPGAESSILVQPHFSYHEAQIQFCGQRGWGTTVPCPRANLYGRNAGDVPQWEDEAWLPVPVLSDRVGFDRPVQLDVYASTERVYLFVDGRPTGCAVLPAGQMPEGEVTVAFRAIIDEPWKDELIREEPGRTYERDFSHLHSDRRMDDFGIALDVPAPSWDESVLPCGRRWYGGRLIED
jgi:hypothetical protein